MDIVLKHCVDESKFIKSKERIDRFYMINKTMCVALREFSSIEPLRLYNFEYANIHESCAIKLNSKCHLLGTKGATCIIQSSADIYAGEEHARIKTSIIEFNVFTRVITEEIELVSEIFNNKCITIGNYIYCTNGYIYDIDKSKIYYITNFPECDDFRMYGKELYATNTKRKKDCYDISPENIIFYKSGECKLKKTSACDKKFNNIYLDEKLYVMKQAEYLMIYKVRNDDENIMFQYLTRCKINIQPNQITSICKVKNNVILCCNERMYQIKINKNTDIHDAEIAISTASVIRDELFDRATTQEWC